MYSMYSNLNKYKFTYTFIITSLLIFVIDIIGNFSLFNLFSLNVVNTVYKFELWRLFTYPFVNQNIFELGVTLTLGAYFISKFENFVTTKYISFTFIYFTLIFGLLHTVLNINFDTKSYFGSESFIIFCIINHIFINEYDRYYNVYLQKLHPDNKIIYSYSKNNTNKFIVNFKYQFSTFFIENYQYYFKKNTGSPLLSYKNLFLKYNLPIITLSLWFFKEIYSYSTMLNFNVYSCFIEFSFAIFVASLLKNNVYVYENLENSNIKPNYENLEEVEENKFAHSVINKSNNSKTAKPKIQTSLRDEKLIMDNYNSSFAENNYLYDNKTSEEEKIDGILDRINEIGKDEITKEELNFLMKYSEK